MGLLNEINNVSRTLQDTQQKELTKTEQKELQQIRQQKLLILLKKNIKELFEEVKSSKDVDELTIELLKHKKDNIRILSESYFDTYEIKLNCYELNYLDEIYNKTVFKIKKEYAEIYKEDIKRQREELKRQKELDKIQIISKQEEAKQRQQKAMARQQTFNAIITILKYTMLLLATPFILIIAFVFGICKSIK